MRGHSFEKKRGNLFVVKIIGNMYQMLGRKVTAFRITAQRRNRVADSISNFETSNFAAQFLDDSDCFKSNHRWTWWYRPWMRYSTAVIGVCKIEPYRCMTQSHFIGSKLGQWPWLPAHVFRRSKFMNNLCVIVHIYLQNDLAAAQLQISPSTPSLSCIIGLVVVNCTRCFISGYR